MMKTEPRSVLAFGLEMMAATFLDCVRVGEKDSMNKGQSMFLEKFLSSLSQSAQETEDILTEMILRGFSHPLFDQDLDIDSFKERSESTLRSIFGETPTESRPEVSRQEMLDAGMAFCERLYTLHERLRFFERFVEEVQMNVPLSDKTKEAIRELSENTPLFSKEWGGYYRHVLEKKHITKKYTSKEWRKLLVSSLEDAFEKEKWFAQRMLNFSMGRFYETSETERIPFEVKIPKDVTRVTDVDELEDAALPLFGDYFFGYQGEVGILLKNNVSIVGVDCEVPEGETMRFLFEDVIFVSNEAFERREDILEPFPLDVTVKVLNLLTQKIEHQQFEVYISFE